MSDAHTPRTTVRRLSTPQGHQIYTTTRDVAVEFPLPVIGSAMSASNFIAGFTGHYILDVSEAPLSHNAKRVTVTHGAFPSGTFTEYESQAYTFPPIYPNESGFMPGGSRARQRVVTARVTYEYRLAPGSWLTDPAIWDFSTLSTGPFEVRSYIAQAAGEDYERRGGEYSQVGAWLNSWYIGVDTLNDFLAVTIPGELYYEIGASAPSATTYASWVAAGTELIAARTVHKWYCGYMRRTAYVKAQ